MKVILSLLVFLSVQSFAVSENDLEKIYFSDVIPTLAVKSKSAFFNGVDHKKIHYYHYKVNNPSGVLVIVPGNAEPALRFSEVVYDLKDAGVDIFVIDHRGQGFSERWLTNSQISHVENFNDYVTDLNTFIADIVHPDSYKKSVLLCHSMGGAVCGGHLKAYPTLFNQVIMTSPMMRIFTPYSNILNTELISLYLAKKQTKEGHGSEYAKTQKDYDFNLPFEGNFRTQSLVRFNMMAEVFKQNPETIIGGASARWTETAIEYTRNIRKTPELFKVPTLILQATADTRVMPKEQKQVCDLSPKFCHLEKIEGSRHAIFNELDVYRNQALAHVRKAIGQ